MGNNSVWIVLGFVAVIVALGGWYVASGDGGATPGIEPASLEPPAADAPVIEPPAVADPAIEAPATGEAVGN